MATCTGCGEELGDAAQCRSCGLVVPGQLSPVRAVQEQWTIMASSGPVVLGQSEHEFAVYDLQRTYGRWPRTDDGYRYACEAYEAHCQSLAHGLAYSAAGYQDPARLGLPTEPVLKSKTYSAPLSYIGSFRRIVPWASKFAKRSPLHAALGWTLGIISLVLVWAFVTVWYFFVFGLFGIFVIPYRLVRRSSRKTQHIQATALATQQAMFQQQQALLQQLAQQQMMTAQSAPQALSATVPQSPPELPVPPA